MRTIPMNRRGYTLVEMLIAVALTLVMMAAVAEVFAMIGSGVTKARAAIEMNAGLRATAQRLQEDLKNITVKMQPPRRQGDGYFEIIKGAPVVATDTNTGLLDTTVGQVADIAMFTVRSDKEPFIGRNGAGTIESHEAEIAWFIRGNKLYRRVLLIAPTAPLVSNDPANFYQDHDLSVRMEGEVNPSVPGSSWVVPNTLADLTMPENRFAHRNYHYAPSASGDPKPWKVGYPFHPHVYLANGVLRATPWASLAGGGGGLGLPTLAECTTQNPPLPDPSKSNSQLPWYAGGPLRIDFPLNPNLPSPINPGASPVPGSLAFDAWQAPYPWNAVSPTTGCLIKYHDPENTAPTYFPAKRVNEDVILSNVISFDVKVWDPGAPMILAYNDMGTPADLTDDVETIVSPGDPAYVTVALPNVGTKVGNITYSIVGYGAYVDLGYAPAYVPLAGAPLPSFSQTGGAKDMGGFRFYDTWSTHYEERMGGNGVNGFDDNMDGVVDDPGEWTYPPPYWAPLRGVQIKIRVFEPDSRQIREVTVVQEFISK